MARTETINPELRSAQSIIEAVGNGISKVGDIATLTGLNPATVSDYCLKLTKQGLLEKVGHGAYVITNAEKQNEQQTNHKPIRSQLHHHISSMVEVDRRKVEIPEFLKTKEPVTLFIERSPEEVEGVMKLEVKIGNNIIPIQLPKDMRICIGEDVPRYSDMQVTYENVTMYRITYSSGSQFDYSHDPHKPFTVDMRK